MKVLNVFSLGLILVLSLLPVLLTAEKPDHEKTKLIEKSFAINNESEVLFDHSRGHLTVKYIDGSEGKIEATVTVKGDDLDDVQTILNAMEVGVESFGNRIEINTGDNIKTWNTVNALIFSRSKIVLKNGTTIRSKVDRISINAILYLPRVKELSLSIKYDDIRIESCEAEELNIDIRSGKLKIASNDAKTKVEIKYGEIDIKQSGDLTLESHDSKGTIGNTGNLVLFDKYSDFKIGNIRSLNADLHDGDFEIGMIDGDANISDKYSEIQFDNMKDGVWDLHDSKIDIGEAGSLRIDTKYSDIDIEKVVTLKLDAHDDNFTIGKVSQLEISESKYSGFDINELGLKLDIEYSHDDDFEIERLSSNFKGLEFNGKYTDLSLPLPSGKGYKLKGKLKYGDFKYSKSVLKETRYIKDNDRLEIEAVAANGSSDMIINIEAHDCKIDLGRD